MANKTKETRRKVLGQLKAESGSTDAISKALGSMAVRNTLRSLERSNLVSREQTDRGAASVWSITSEGEAWLGANA